MHFQSKLRSSGVDHSANAEQAAAQLFPTNAAAECWFAWQRWQGEETCPHCRSLSIQKGAQHKSMPYRCRSCGKRFSVRTGTVMESSNLGYRIWALAMQAYATLGSGLSSMKLHRDLGISYKSAWHLLQRLRQIRQDWQNPLFDCINGLIRFASASQEGNGHLLPRVGLGRRMADETRAIPSIGWKILIEDAATLPAESKHPSWMICHEETASDHSSGLPPNGRSPPPPPPRSSSTVAI